ncbi:MORN repeat-containing protein 5-like isoform X2 [Galleria mellonella]|uniref:MORN repeat-containing protein 5 n=1 Tax=Galleria mellonella TaxID=7137 RepID=A0A6J3C2X2_GALME|nr:MORN repeat-containing protein 5-like isoform X2 [Galleria mellonella]
MSQQKSQNNSVISDKRISQWEALMRKFSEAHREQCKTVSVDIPRVPRSIKQFPTGSQYEGTWDVLGMSGVGIYTFPNGVLYEGEFNDGMFHGVGELRYPSGIILKGKWYKGQMVEKTLIFADGLEYNDTDWKYCRMPDRRFTIEYEKGLQPGGQSYLTADQPTREIPPGYYDTGDGFFDPKTKVVYKADNLTTIIRSPSVREQKWIIDNCRTFPESEVGPRLDLYEKWSEPQVDPEPPPSPASSSHGPAPVRKSQLFFEDANEVQEDFYIPNSKHEEQVFTQSSSRPRKRTLISFRTESTEYTNLM